MRAHISRLTGRRGFVTLLAVAVAMLLVGVAYAGVGGGESGEHANPAASVSNQSHGQSAEQHGGGVGALGEGEGVRGGPQPRIHAGCDFPGDDPAWNWTHGDYVSAVAEANPGDSEKISEAAQSDCGKVDHTASGAVHGQSSEAHGKSGEPHGKSGDHRPEGAGS